MTNPIATIATLLALTLPQRKALGAHLVAYAFGAEGQRAHFPELILAITVAQAQAISDRITAWGETKVTDGGRYQGPDPEDVGNAIVTRDAASYVIWDADLAVLHAAVYLSPARDLIPGATLRTLERAWTKLGWTWAWASYSGGSHEDEQAQALAAWTKVRTIMNPPAAPPITDSFEPLAESGRTSMAAPEPVFRYTEPEVLGEPEPQIGPQVNFAEPVKTFLDKAVAWADGLPGALDPAALDFGPPDVLIVDDPQVRTPPEARPAVAAWFDKTLAGRLDLRPDGSLPGPERGPSTEDTDPNYCLRAHGRKCTFHRTGGSQKLACGADNGADRKPVWND